MDNKKNYAVMDGNTAAAYSAYAFTEVAAIYPITPSSPMAEKVDEWSAKGKKNLFGTTVDVIQMQSEAGAAGTCHGSLQAGALTTTFTSSQGLMLMIPAMYAMGGQFLPSVMHIASRVVTSNHHSIFGDHTDFMTCRTTGYGMLMSSSPQEAMDLSAVAHLSAIKARYAFMHCFDGFRTSHEMQRIETLDYEDLRGLVDQKALQEFRRQSLNPEHPTNRGNNVNPDIYFQCKEGANVKSAIVPDTIQHYMDEINKLTGRDYKLFNYYGAPDAEEVIVVMCSASEAVKETVDYLNAQGRKVGMVQIHLYRPFSVKHFAAAIPASVKKIAVLDRSKETGSVGEPVYLDVVTALNQAGRNDITVVGGRYGLSSKDTTPGQFIAVYDNLAKEQPKNNFTIGINDDVTHTSLDYTEIELPHPGQISCKLWGLGGDGWAYDIGFGGIDHVMAQNQDVNLLVLDTEVYSNTGGQSSKATPTSATAKFAASGKKVAKKDLGAILMQYEYVYVAQVAMGADQAQTLKALREAESYDGPSIVICYCPCLEQHIKAGMGTSQDEMKKAVECGYWHLYRYDPRRIAEGKNPFQLDSKEPDTDKVMDFLMGENRFASLKNNFPDKAEALYAKEVEDVKARYARYKKLAED